MSLSNLQKDDSLLLRVSDLDDTFTLTRNLTVGEFKSKDGADFFFVHPGLLVAYQKIRDVVRVPLQVRSGYRSEAHNRRINGSQNSMHLYGMAIDVSPIVEPKRKADFLKIIYDTAKSIGLGGVKLYNEKSFVHFDVGPKREW